MNKAIWGFGGAVLAVIATSASAHHSYAQFDFMKTVDVKGTVKEFHYTNPHSSLVLQPAGSTDPASELAFEANGPGYLVRSGWHRTSVKPGDVLTVTYNPLRNGAPGGSLVKVTFPDGHQLVTR